ncbi:phage baseplate protein [Klebsiella variicola subsp. variicola]|uniref:phage baseplate protein n=1 Tax=Klebsiella variicola TaxID=244366 RepID=UPI0035BBBD47
MASVNDTTSTKSTSKTKSDNGFCVIASMSNESSTSYIQEYSAISFDSVPQIGVKRRADVSSYAIESGSEVSDHIQIKNDTINLSGWITESPIELRGDIISSNGANGTRVRQAIDWLNTTFEARQTISLVTRDAVLENVVLTGISYDYDDALDAMKFDLSFEKIRLVSSKEVDVIATKTKSTTNKGKTVKTKAPTSNTPKKDSTITNLSSQYNS